MQNPRFMGTPLHDHQAPQKLWHQKGVKTILNFEIVFTPY
ncbi:hypothetical protein HMPREF9103_00703 [Lentilactobacillus parafarraginis F0439]|uniref:Uncharacterized protein n=1 Tax=Lentilactobacillus parafarraginis F0439 TaxID=797515 RepID=G9ZLV5_9LACO|nr:hypothetical protein HMPREF9103_00703 [Lentilactobacillus parafarraginis F0439]